MLVEPIDMRAPVLLGGLEGSGTTITTRIMIALGLFTGPPAITSRDHANHWFDPRMHAMDREPEALWRPRLASFNALMRSAAFAASRHDPASVRGWGWKSTLNYLFLEQLAKTYRRVRYIHILRNPYDLAYGHIYDQFNRYRSVVGIGGGAAGGPRWRELWTDWWLRANRRAIAAARKVAPGRNGIVVFEVLCADPRATVERIRDLAGLRSSEDQVARAVALVRTPSTIGRSRGKDLSYLRVDQIDAIRKLGYEPWR